MLKTLIMFGVAAAALSGTQARASDFGYTGGEQTYTITTTGLYNFTAGGATGGAGCYTSGGQGALLNGQVALTQGSVLDIFVGGAGGAGDGSGGGGGGGAFAFLQAPNGVLTADNALIVAGGGGGGGIDASYTGESSTRFGGSGEGGSGGYGSGGGGAGVSSDGASSSYFSTFAGGGYTPTHGGQGGAGAQGYVFGPISGGNGGFGGGGGGATSGGGGGGFTGGDGGTYILAGGGAGTSYLRDDVTLLSQGLNGRTDGDGYFDIALASPAVSAAPEPATWLELLMGVGAMGLLMRRAKGTSGLRATGSLAS